MGAEELVKHLTECRNVAAAVVYDGDATAVVQQMLADGWTYQGEETVEGKRLRYLVPPPELAERLSGATENPDHRPLPHGGYACTKWGCTEHQNAESHYGVRGSQTIGEHEATRDDPECRYPNGVCTCSGSPHSAAEARVCACPPSICYSGEARALDLPCRANAEPTEHPMRPCDCDECRVKLAAIDELSKIMQSDDYLRPEPRNADSACEGEVAGICSGGPAHHPHCPSARYGLPDEGPA